jgi:hypothetical protein
VYLIKADIYSTHYDKLTNAYRLKDIFTGEWAAEEKMQELLTSGHLLTLDDYQDKIKSNDYKTIMVYIKIDFSPMVTKKMSHPTSLLQGYALTLHKDDVIPFTVNYNVYNLPLDDYMAFLRYYYLRFLKMTYTNFDVHSKIGLKEWNLININQEYMDAAADTLTEFLQFCEEPTHGQNYSRTQFDIYVRTSAWILNQSQLITQGVDLYDVETQVRAINEDLYNDINTLKYYEDFAENLRTIRGLYMNYIDRLSTGTILERYVKYTLTWIMNFVSTNILKKDVEFYRNIASRYKRYFLPIYTQFYFEMIYIYIIRGNMMRLYYDDEAHIKLDLGHSSLLEMRDGQTMRISTPRKDEMEFIDTAHTTLNPVIDDNIFNEDFAKTYITPSFVSLGRVNDNPNSNIEATQNDMTDIIDSVTVTVTESE